MRRREFITVLTIAITWPFASQAQKVYRIALVHPMVQVGDMSETGAHPFFRALFGQLRRLGYVEGQNLIVQRYSGGGRIEQYSELTRDVVRSGPDLIFSISARLAQQFRRATSSIPIVGITNDPVTLGIATSLARPGGNITGIVPDAGLELYRKHVEALKEAVPTASKIAFIAPRLEESASGAMIRDEAERVGISLISFPLDTPIQEAEYQRAFAAMAREHVDAIIISNSAEHYTHRYLLVGLAEKAGLPALYPERWFVETGGLMSYGADISALYRYAAGQIDQIFKGAKPGEIPFYQATKIELVINLKTAKSLGLAIPPSLQLRADELIE